MMAAPAATGLFMSVGQMIGAIGAVPVVLICIGLSVVALLQNRLFSEMAAMFPDKPGGVAMYVAEGWKRHFAPIVPVAAFGYWTGWAVVVSLAGLTIGSLAQAQWFPDATWVLFSVAGVDVGLVQVIATIAVVACSVMNVLGIRVALRFNQVVGAVFLLALLVLVVGPFVAGQWDVSNLTTRDGAGSWVTIVVWIYVSAWSIYGSELVAIFAPEYRDTTRDTSRALMSISLFMIFVYTLVPISTTGQLGEDVIAENPITYGVVAIGQLVGGLSHVLTLVLCGALFMGMLSASADSGRALLGLSVEKMSIRQLDQLNAKGIPSRAIWVTMLANIAVVIVVGNPVAILVASNLGFLLSITLAVIAFLLLRRDRPRWPRPIKLSNRWIAVAFVVGGFDVFVLVVGALNPGESHAGSFHEVLIGLGILAVGLLLFGYRKIVQDRVGVPLRERDPEAERSDDRSREGEAQLP